MFLAELAYICGKSAKNAMLLDFKVANFRSIGEEQILSLIPASNHKEYPENIVESGKYAALNTISIYGANSSGKSNLLLAFYVMKLMVLTSAKNSSTDALPWLPFLLKEGLEQSDTKFEILFVLKGIRYRYGYQYNSERVASEWLMRKQSGRETAVFQRQGEVIDISSGINGSSRLIDAAVEGTKPNNLFLSMADAFNVEEAKDIISWFNDMDTLNTRSSLNLAKQTDSLLKDAEYNAAIRGYLKSLNLGIEDVVSEDPDKANPSQSPIFKAVHNLYDTEGKLKGGTTAWDFTSFESSGSNRALHISGSVVKSLKTGGVLIIDEVEAFMHPIMTLSLIELFMSPESNPKRTQLIFSTHDTNLLNYLKLRRDQVYFMEKNRWESSELFSLSDFKYKNAEGEDTTERWDSDKEKRYIEGRYGAIPFLGGFKRFMREEIWREGEK